MADKNLEDLYKSIYEKKANKDYDGDGKVESGSKEHAGAVHNAIQRKRGLKPDGQDTRKEEVELDERYKGKHGQSEKEYADSRSSGGKMVSGDSKQSGAEYTHGRRVKAANPGMQPDVGGKTKPKSQGKMDRGTRADLEYRKANLKKEEVEAVDEKFSMAADSSKPESPRPTRKAENRKGMSLRSRAVKAVGTQTRQDKETGIREDKREELEATGIFTAEEIERILDIMCD